MFVYLCAVIRFTILSNSADMVNLFLIFTINLLWSALFVVFPKIARFFSYQLLLNTC